MPDLKESILELLQSSDGHTDREIAHLLQGYGAQQQIVKIACRELAIHGNIFRSKRDDGLIANYLTHPDTQPHPVSRRPIRPAPANSNNHLSEDMVKGYLVSYLQSQGWRTLAALGKTHGIDIDASREGQRWIIEVKGVGSLSAMRINYFLASLGEILQRMNDPQVRYSIALPDLPQYRRLWERLPRLAKERTGITILLVAGDSSVIELN